MRHTAPQTPKAFTLIELLVTLGIVAVLITLLVLGIRQARRSAASTVDASAVDAVVAGIQEFRAQFGFLPPMVADQLRPTEDPVLASGGIKRVNIVSVAVQADRDKLNTLPTGAQLTDKVNIFGEDDRFSELSLAYYLAGALDEPITGDPLNRPLDGVRGPGMYAPDRSGGFQVSANVLRNSNLRPRAKTYASLVPLGATLKLSQDENDARYVRLVDRNGVALRYYQWISGEEETANSGRYIIDDLEDLRIPRLVARNLAEKSSGGLVDPVVENFDTPDEKNPVTNTRLRSATFAVVAAGPNGVFGDEAIDVIAQKLGVGVPESADEAQTRRVREQAEADNIIRVGGA